MALCNLLKIDRVEIKWYEASYSKFIIAAVLWKYTECRSDLYVIMLFSEIKPCVYTVQEQYIHQ
jgi:hypothetical protein